MIISSKQFIKKFERIVRELGGTKKAGEALGFKDPFISNVLNGKELPSKKLCAKLGAKPIRSITYRYDFTDSEGTGKA